MRRIAITLCVVLAITAAIAGFKVAHAQTGFSNASLSGGYLITTMGSDSYAVGVNTTAPPVSVACNAPTAPSGATAESASITVLVPASNTSGPNISCSASLITGHSDFAIQTPLQVEGDFVADGNGNITNGNGSVNRQTLTTTTGATYTVVDNSCDFIFTGTYSINSTGTGILTISPVGGCIQGAVAITFRVRLSNNGSAGILTLNAPNPGRFNTVLTGTLLKR